MGPSCNLLLKTNVERFKVSGPADLQEILDCQAWKVAVKVATAKALTARHHTLKQAENFRSQLGATDEELTAAIFAAKKAEYFSKSPEFKACASEILDELTKLKKGIREAELILDKTCNKNILVRSFSSCMAFVVQRKTLYRKAKDSRAHHLFSRYGQ